MISDATSSALTANPFSARIGTGTGVIAALLARRGVKRVVATDQDPRALACAAENLARLKLAPKVELLQAALERRLAVLGAALITERRAALARLDRLRQTLGHMETLKRGFAVIRGPEGEVVTSAAPAAAIPAVAMAAGWALTVDARSYVDTTLAYMGEVRDYYNSSLAGLGSWLGPDETPQGGLVAARTIASDWSLWQGLVPADPSTAGTEHLEQALGLVRGRPFAGVHPRHYVWAQALRSQMIFAITTAATELARARRDE